VRKRAALVTVVRVSGLILLAVVGASAATPTKTSSTATSKLGYSELSNGRGGTNVEAFVIPDGFDKARSLAAFKDTLYPVVRACTKDCIVAGRSAPWSTWMFFPPPPPRPPLPPPPLPAPPAAATVRVPAVLVRSSTTTGTCSSVRFAPSPFMRATVVVQPSRSAFLLLTRSSEWHEAQTVLTRFAATASGPLEAGAAPSGVWARLTNATNTRNAARVRESFAMEAIIRDLQLKERRPALEIA
jgi:hypothetical protein